MKDRPLDVIEQHECTVLEKFNSRQRKIQYGIQRLSDGHWYWTRWTDKKGNTADGIAYCPYCGGKL